MTTARKAPAKRAPRKTAAQKAEELAQSETERAEMIVDYRLQGKPWSSIAKLVNLPVGEAKAIHDAHLREVDREPAELVRAAHRVRLNRYMQGVHAAAKRGDTEAIGDAVKLLKREAELLGLDRPSRVEVGITASSFAERMEKLFVDLGIEVDPEIARRAEIARRVRGDGNLVELPRYPGARVQPVIDADVVEQPNPFDSIPEDEPWSNL